MSLELVYTSAPRGLKPGSRGFCTVLCTRGMPSNLVELLESLSGYRHLFPIHDPRAGQNPVNYCHWIVKVGGKRYHVLSRIANAGKDYSGRSNKLAHHVVLEPQECPPGGPAWVLKDPRFCRRSWTGEPRQVAQGPRPRTDLPPQAPCRTWEQVTGDAGWAGQLAQWTVQGKLPVYIIVPLGVDVLDLVCEAMSLLPPTKRWEVSFSTYFTQVPAGISCLWRFVVEGSPEADKARRDFRLNVLDLSSPLSSPAESPWVHAARTGEPVVDAPQPASAQVVDSPAPLVPAASSPSPASLPPVRTSAQESTRGTPSPPELPPRGRRKVFQRPFWSGWSFVLGMVVGVILAAPATGVLTWWLLGSSGGVVQTASSEESSSSSASTTQEPQNPNPTPANNSSQKQPHRPNFRQSGKNKSHQQKSMANFPSSGQSQTNNRPERPQKKSGGPTHKASKLAAKGGKSSASAHSPSASSASSGNQSPGADRSTKNSPSTYAEVFPTVPEELLTVSFCVPLILPSTRNTWQPVRVWKSNQPLKIRSESVSLDILYDREVSNGEWKIVKKQNTWVLNLQTTGLPDRIAEFRVKDGQLEINLKTSRIEPLKTCILVVKASVGKQSFNRRFALVVPTESDPIDVVGTGKKSIPLPIAIGSRKGSRLYVTVKLFSENKSYFLKRRGPVSLKSNDKLKIEQDSLVDIDTSQGLFHFCFLNGGEPRSNSVSVESLLAILSVKVLCPRQEKKVIVSVAPKIFLGEYRELGNQPSVEELKNALVFFQKIKKYRFEDIEGVVNDMEVQVNKAIKTLQHRKDKSKAKATKNQQATKNQLEVEREKWDKVGIRVKNARELINHMKDGKVKLKIKVYLLVGDQRILLHKTKGF